MNSRGFTLLEVLVAFVIIAVVLGAAYPGLGSAARTQGRVAEVLAATAHAESTLARIGTDLPMHRGTREIVLADGWRARVSLRPIRPEEAELWGLLGRAPWHLRVQALPPGADAAAVVLESLRIGPLPEDEQ